VTDLPAHPARPHAAACAPPTPPAPLLADVWPDPGHQASPAVLGGAAGAGLLGALVVPGLQHHGLGILLVLLAVMAVAGMVAWSRRTGYLLTAGLLCLGLVSTVILRDAGWIVGLCVLAAFGLGSIALAGGRTTVGMLVSTAAVPLAGLRGLPWLGRGVASAGGATSASLAPAVRTGVMSLALLVVFGTLFASADAVFAEWVEALVPDLSLADLPVRVIVFAFVAGLALAGAYVAAVPPPVDRLAPGAGRPVRRFEWAVPVALVNALFALFLLAQATALFGGHDHLQRTTGLTYAEYVHQGFGQLTTATLLTLVVVAAAARKAPRTEPSDRRLLRVLLGLLCGFTLVVVASALYRIHLYEQAYGFTRMRLLASAFEAWLGLLVALAMVAGVRLRGSWLPRAAVTTGPAVLLSLAMLNPDAYVAERNLERFERTGRIDWFYLNQLSADAVPTLDRLPEPYRSCAMHSVGESDSWLDWNLGRARVTALPVDVGERCRDLPSG
jgi:two-component system sensor histidine kinase BaeS